MISNKNLSKDIAHGGLKLTDLVVQAKALKLTWIQRLYTTEGRWQDLYKIIFNESELQQIWELDTKSLIHLSKKIKNKFWGDILQQWAQYINKINPTENVLQYPIWNSFFINNPNLAKIKNVLIINGCKKIKDLYNKENRSWYSYVEFMNKFGRINALDYMSVIHSIPRLWKIHIEQEIFINENIMPIWLTDIITQNKVCKFIYWYVIENQTKQDNYNNEITWSMELDLDFDVRDRVNWSNTYYMANRATLDTNLRTFQYKLLNRSLVTNIQLRRFGIKESEQCDFCNLYAETYEHLFFYCRHVRYLWSDLENWLRPNLVMIENLTVKEIIFGYRYESVENNLMNFIIIILKKYI